MKIQIGMLCLFLIVLSGAFSSLGFAQVYVSEPKEPVFLAPQRVSPEPYASLPGADAVSPQPKKREYQRIYKSGKLVEEVFPDGTIALFTYLDDETIEVRILNEQVLSITGKDRVLFDQINKNVFAGG